MRDHPKAQDLLDWYDLNARNLAWRISPAAHRDGVIPDPYRIWLSEIMLQQTTVAAVTTYFLRFTSLWPTVQSLAAAKDADVMAEWAGLGYYARARNLLKCARIVANDLGGIFPTDRDALLKLPGIGPYTASAISAIAYDHPATVVDGNVERVMARLFDEHMPLPAAKPLLTQHASTLTPNTRPGDYAQAVMDLGATVCTPKKPTCGLCPWRAPCLARQNGTAVGLPKKTPKKPKPIRFGTVYIAQRSDGAWLLERRPDRGLLGGMLGWPGSDWTEENAPHHQPPLHANWQILPAEARHTFTHFHLRLSVQIAQVSDNAEAEQGSFVPASEFRRSALPTVMRKAFDLTLKAPND